jgi:hypothetical protein
MNHDDLPKSVLNFEPHAEMCEMCRDVFCPSCMYFHEREHPKPARAEHEKPQRRRTA